MHECGDDRDERDLAGSAGSSVGDIAGVDWRREHCGGATDGEALLPAGCCRVEDRFRRKKGNVEAEVIVLTEAIAIKETGPKETVAKFGEVYAFSPAFIAIRREVPTMLTFWNLQPDDEHDLMLTAPDLTVLMHLTLAPLSKTSYVLTFHQDGIFTFYCTVHQPEMNGQILVLPPTGTP